MFAIQGCADRVVVYKVGVLFPPGQSVPMHAIKVHVGKNHHRIDSFEMGFDMVPYYFAQLAANFLVGPYVRHCREHFSKIWVGGKLLLGRDSFRIVPLEGNALSPTEEVRAKRAPSPEFDT